MPRRTTQALIANAISACQQAGLAIGAVEVAPGGVVRILAPEATRPLGSASEENSCDSLFDTESASNT